MQQKAFTLLNKGMNRDLSISKAGESSAYENHNIRIEARDNDTFLSVTNERGNKQIPLGEFVSINGKLIGWNVLNNHIILFTHDPVAKANNEKCDRIYRIDYVDKVFHMDYNGIVPSRKPIFEGNLDFDLDHPIESVVYFETEDIQKIYWLDGKNVLRFMNFTEKRDSNGRFPWQYDNGVCDNTYFDSNRIANFGAIAKITKDNSGNTRPNGVIQYLLTYYNKHGQETGIVWASDLVYLSPVNNGGATDGTNNNKVTIEFFDMDKSYTNYRVYAIFRSSINANPVAYIVADGKIEKKTQSLMLLALNGKETEIDTGEPNHGEFLPDDEGGGGSGNSGDNDTPGGSTDVTTPVAPDPHDIPDLNPNPTPFFPDEPSNVVKADAVVVDDWSHLEAIDITRLLYLGSQPVKASTLTHKDQTLFLGDLQSIGKNNYAEMESAAAGMRQLENCIEFIYSDGDGTICDIPYYEDTGVYNYKSQLGLTSSQILSFKGGEKYRFALSFRRKDGTMTEAFWIGDYENKLYPVIDAGKKVIKRVVAKCTITGDVKSAMIACGFETAQLMIAEATYADRSVKAQGIINPTMFNVWDRYNNGLYSEASWISRPKNSGYACNHFEPVHNSTSSTGEIECNYWRTSSAPTPYYRLDANNKYIDEFDGKPEADYRMIIYKITARGGAASFSSNVTHYEVGATVINAVAYTTSGRNSIENYIFPENYKNASGWTKTDKGYKYKDSNYSISVYSIGDYKSAMNESASSAYSIITGELISKCDVEVDDASLADEGKFISWCDIVDDPGETRYFNYKYSSKHYIEEIYALNNSDTDSTSGNHDKDRWSLPQGGEDPSAIDYAPSFYKKHLMFVDENVLTLNSPELEYEAVSFDDATGYKLRVVGVAKITATAGDYTVYATPGKLAGENLLGEKFIANSSSGNMDGLISWPLWREQGLRDNNDEGYSGTDNVTKKTSDDYKWGGGIVNYWLHMWNHSGKINGFTDEDNSDYSRLISKVFANLKYSYTTIYSKTSDSAWTSALDSLRIFNYTSSQYVRIKAGNTNYYYDANVSESLMPPRSHKYPVLYSVDAEDTGSEAKSELAYLYLNTPVSLEYLSTPHAVFALPTTDNLTGGRYIQTLAPYVRYNNQNISNPFSNQSRAICPWWGGSNTAYTNVGYSASQTPFTLTPDSKASSLKPGDRYLLIGEIYRDFGINDTRYGDVKNNRFVVAGPQYTILQLSRNGSENVMYANQGDTYIQRWDCLKTKPADKTDATNGVIDITSVMLETHINIDGRTDKQREVGYLASINASEYGSLNTVYSQQDNYFAQRDLDEDFNQDVYGANITWTLEKHDSAEIDEWSHITLANTLKLDGDKGSCRALRRFQNSIIAFQDRGIAEVLFNSRTQLTTTDGVPVEIANSGKVDGKRYISNKYGCVNKWSIVEGKSALYFVDNINKAFCAFNGNVEQLSSRLGFDVWFRRGNTTDSWKPSDFGSSESNTLVSFYDRVHSDIYLVRNSKDDEPCLVYNENLSAFTSFFDYSRVPMMTNVGDRFVSFRDNFLWLQNEGYYCRFFGEQKDFWTIYRVTPDPYGDKIWTNVEYRADFYQMLDQYSTMLIPKEKELINADRYSNIFDAYKESETFSTYKLWNEYQTTGDVPLRRDDAFTDPVRKKFRIWRLTIPRALKNDTNRHGLDRMRNPWINIEFRKHMDDDKFMMQLHDIVIKYFE